jgi:DivIVA domain-containing protein
VLHLLWYGLLAVALAVGLFVLAARFLPAGEQIAPPLRDEAPWELPPDGSLRPEDIDAVRLPVALRGYRFAETDLLLDRLAGELRARDAEIARLRGTTSTLIGAPRPQPAAAAITDDGDTDEAVDTDTDADRGGDEPS